MAASRKECKKGTAETEGWRKLMEWLAVTGNTMSSLARIAQVSQPSAHAWRWRDKKPKGYALRAVCQLTGASEKDWESPTKTVRGKRAA